jgi:broad specificity phosphatase PhoE
MYPLNIRQFALPSPFDAVWLGRHGQCRLNLAELEAERRGEDTIRRALGRSGGGLTERGERDACSLGIQMRKFRPTLIVSSPLPRALDSAKWVAIALLSAGIEVEIVVHPALYDRLVGDRGGYISTRAYLNHADRKERERCRELGKLYYAAPGGEPYANCCQRAGNAFRDIAQTHGGRHERVLFMVHNSIVRALAAVCCGMTEREFVAFCKLKVPNGSIFGLRRNDEGFLSPVPGEGLVVPPLIPKREWKGWIKEKPLEAAPELKRAA